MFEKAYEYIEVIAVQFLACQDWVGMILGRYICFSSLGNYMFTDVLENARIRIQPRALCKCVYVAVY